jgi:hypothetical protein
VARTWDRRTRGGGGSGPASGPRGVAPGGPRGWAS